MKHAIPACLLIIFLCFGCSNSKTITAGDALERFQENGMYYLIDPKNDGPGGGVFDGTVEKIGWNQDWILARIIRLYGGDTNGWYALNLKTKQVIGPIPQNDLETNASLSRIECRDSAAVFAGKR
jgi:hypothetical protein